MHLLPGAMLTFVDNTASQLGGGIAAENFIGGNHTTLILNNNCFIQYNIGGKYEHQPSNWNVSDMIIMMQTYPWVLCPVLKLCYLMPYRLV